MSFAINLKVPFFKPDALGVVCLVGSFHKYLYPLLPPETDVEILPSDPLKQFTLSTAVTNKETLAGSSTEADLDILHPFASVTTKVYVPFSRFDAFAVVCFAASSHK